MERNYKLYVHISPSNKRYYGITKQKVNRRWQNGKGYKFYIDKEGKEHGNEHFWNSICLYGWDNFEHIVLFEGLTKEEAELMEKCYIALYDTTNPSKGYNILDGGDAFDGLKGELNGMYGVHRYGKDNPNYGRKHTNESREKISKNHADVSGGNNPNAKFVKNKTTGEIFPSCKEAGEKYNVTPSAIAQSIRRVNKCCGYYWEYIDEPKDIENIKDIVESRPRGRKGKQVINVDTGEIFENTRLAEEKYNLSRSCISRAINNGYKSGGYHWEYVENIENIEEAS